MDLGPSPLRTAAFAQFARLPSLGAENLTGQRGARNSKGHNGVFNPAISAAYPGATVAFLGTRFGKAQPQVPSTEMFQL
jgi:hypothetical protein